MKKNLLTLTLIIISLSACNERDETASKVEDGSNTLVKNKSEKVNSQEDFLKIKKESEITFAKLNDAIFKNVKTTTSNNSEGNVNSIVAPGENQQNIFGPFDLIVPITGPVATEQKIIYNGGTSYPPPGIYYADVYRYILKVELPANSVGIVDTVYPVGYSNYTNQTSGFTYGMTIENGKNYLVANTYALHLKYNAIGQYLGNLFVPINPNAIKFTYRYIKF